MLNRTTFRRAGAALIAPALAAGMVVAAPSAQAAPNSYAYSAARWLSDQLTNGIVHNEQYNFDDYGLSLDVFFALNSLQTRQSTADSILDAIADDPEPYISYDTPGDTLAGETAKLATAVQTANRNASSFGGVDLLARLDSTIQKSGAELGRVKNVSAFADYTNSISQSFAVRALTTSDSDFADEAVAFLLKQQCNDGSFREAESSQQCTTGTGSVDVTAAALQALFVAKSSDAALQSNINKAVDYLVKVQAPNGSFVGNDVANTNTTGLAATVLKMAGKDGAAGSAATWIVGHQVTDAVAEDTGLANELGAIAYEMPDLAAGKRDGITVSKRGTWVRATAQAAVGVNAQLPAKQLTAKAPTGYVASGSSISVTAAGLVAGEKFTASVAGGATVAGTANAAGVASAKVKTGGSTATRTVTIKGSRTNRIGTASVKVLSAKKLTLKLSSTVKKNKKQSVKASGLAVGEKVRIYVAGKLVKTSKANSTGKYNYSFSVGKKTGKKVVKVVGEFTNRNASKSYKVR